MRKREEKTENSYLYIQMVKLSALRFIDTHMPMTKRYFHLCHIIVVHCSFDLEK